MNKIFLKKKFTFAPEPDGTMKGEISGVAYSGAVIEEHWPFENLIIDVATLQVAKDKTPIFRDHLPSQVAGHGKVSIEGSEVKINGKISKKSIYGQEILDLSEDGFEWEMSLGIYGGDFEEIEDEVEVNGILMKKGVILRNGMLREVSVVALGADKETNAEVFSAKEKKEVHMLTKEQWVKLACGCGGNAETTPDDLEKKFAASQEEIDAKQAEVDELKKKLADAQAELDKIKEDEEAEGREEELKSAVAAKGLELSADKIKDAAKTKESTALLLSFVADMKKAEVVKKIDPKFADKVDLSADAVKGTDDVDTITLRAKAMVKAGEAQTFLEAISKLRGA